MAKYYFTITWADGRRDSTVGPYDTQEDADAERTLAAVANPGDTISAAFSEADNYMTTRPQVISKYTRDGTEYQFWTDGVETQVI